MNEQHFQMLAEQFQFKLTTESVQSIPSGPGGGHLCWKIKSDKETFFIKQLDPMLDIKNKNVIDRYELCESIAFKFSQHGIPAVYALRSNNKYVTVFEDSAYLIYPWIEGYALTGNQIPNENALKVAELVAKIHTLNFDVPEIEPKFDIHTNDEINYILEKAYTQESVCTLLKSNKKIF